jgi:hypothetical protein
MRAAALILTLAMSSAAMRNVAAIQKEQLDATIDSAVAQSQPAAQAALQTFRHIVDSQNYKAMGLDSVGDTGSTALGDPLVVFYVPLDTLRTYQSNANALGLLIGGDRVLYPVLLGRVTRSSITVARDTSGWRGVSYGGPNTARLVWKALNEAISRPAGRSRRYFLVDVLALNLQFLGYEEHGKLFLIPLLDDPRRKLTAGKPKGGERVFAQLGREARANDYDRLR